MRTFPLLVFLFLFLFLFDPATCCLKGGTVVVEGKVTRNIGKSFLINWKCSLEQLTGLLRGKRSIVVEQEDKEPADLTETTLTTEEGNDRTDLELDGATEETGSTVLVI